MHGAIGFGFASHWLKNWHEAFEPITKRNNRNHVITVDSHLKTALLVNYHFLQEPINRSLHVHCILESTFARIFLFLELPFLKEAQFYRENLS